MYRHNAKSKDAVVSAVRSVWIFGEPRWITVVLFAMMVMSVFLMIHAGIVRDSALFWSVMKYGTGFMIGFVLSFVRKVRVHE